MPALREEMIMGSMLVRNCTKIAEKTTDEKAIAYYLKRKENAEKDSQSCSPAKTRSKVDAPFDFKTVCLLCRQ